LYKAIYNLNQAPKVLFKHLTSASRNLILHQADITFFCSHLSLFTTL